MGNSLKKLNYAAASETEAIVCFCPAQIALQHGEHSYCRRRSP